MLQYSFWILGIEAYYFSWFDSFWFLNLWEGVRITTLTVPEKRFFMLSFRNLILVQKKLRYKIQIMGGGGGGGGYCWQLSQIWYFSQIWHFYQNWHFSQILFFLKFDNFVKIDFSIKLYIDTIIIFKFDIFIKKCWFFGQIYNTVELIFLSTIDKNIKNTLFCSSKV